MSHFARLSVRPFSIALSLTVLVALPRAQATLWVDDDNCPGGVGTLADPFCDVQDALDAAEPGDTILVSAGTYGCVDFLGKDVRVSSLEGAALTRIGGVSFTNGESRAAVLDGFTVRGQSCTVGNNGILCDGASPTIANNIIENSLALNGGGGLHVRAGADPSVIHNLIRNNQGIPGSGVGGGILVSQAAAYVEGNRFLGNSVFGDFGGGLGGGMYIVNSTVRVLNNAFESNAAQDEAFNRGGAIYAAASTLELSGNTFSKNVAVVGQPPFETPGEGGALYLASCTTRGAGNILWGDMAFDGQEIFANGGSLELSYSNVELGLGGIAGTTPVQWGPGMLATNPFFTAALHLSAESPLVDAGPPTVESWRTDADLDPRLLDGDEDGSARADMGWDELNRTRVTLTGSGAIGTSLDFLTQGSPGQTYFLAGAFGPGYVPFKSFGAILLGSAGLEILSSGSVPGNDSLAIPNLSALIGLRGHFQSLALTPGAGIGSFSRRVDVRLH